MYWWRRSSSDGGESMLNHHYLKLLGIAFIIPFFIPLLSKTLVYINSLNTITGYYAAFILDHMNQLLGVELPIVLASILGLMIWPFLGIMMIDLFYRYVLKKTFKHYMTWAILLWLFFNYGRFLM